MRTALLGAALLIAVAPDAAQAQDRHGPTLGLGVGAASVAMHVAGESGSNQGVTLHAALGILEVEAQPFAAPNPLGFEQFTSVDLLIDPRINLSSAAYLRPVAGVQFRWWSGSNPVTDFDLGPTVGAVASYQVAMVGGWRVAPQLEWRWGFIEAEGKVYSQQLGIRLQVARPL